MSSSSSQQQLNQFPREVEELLLQTLHFANFLASPPINASTEAQYLMNEIDYISRKVLKTLDKHQNNTPSNNSENNVASPSATFSSVTANNNKAQVTTVEVVEDITKNNNQQPQSPSLSADQIQQQKSLKIITDAIKTAREKAIQSIIESKKISAVNSGVATMDAFLDGAVSSQQQSENKNKNGVDQIFNQQHKNSHSNNHNHDDWWTKDSNNNNNRPSNAANENIASSLSLPPFPSFPANINRSIAQQIQDARKANNNNNSLNSAASKQQPSINNTASKNNKTSGITFANYSGTQQNNNNPISFSMQNLPQQFQNNPTAKSFLENFSSQLKDIVGSSSNNNQKPLSSFESNIGNANTNNNTNSNPTFMNSFMNTMMTMMNNNSNNNSSNLAGLPRPPQASSAHQRNPYQRALNNATMNQSAGNGASTLPVPHVSSQQPPSTFAFSEDVAARTAAVESGLPAASHQAVRRERDEERTMD